MADHAQVLPVFGGPMAGRIIALPRGQSTVAAAMPPRRSELMATDSGPFMPDLRRVTYDKQTVWVHVLARCRFAGPSQLCDSSCLFVADYLIAPGYPQERILDPLLAIAALASWPWPFGPVQ